MAQKRLPIQFNVLLRRIETLIERRAFTIILLWVCGIAVLFCILSIVRHTNYQSGAYDLGLYDQSVWQYSKFTYPYSSVKDRLVLADHLTLTLPLLSPLYWIWSDVRMILIFQAVWIAFSGMAIYKLTQNRGFSKFVSLSVSIVYTLFYGIQYGVFFDFHPIIIGTGLLVWLAYFLETKKRTLFWIFLILSLLTQENMGIALACLGCIYLLNRTYRKVGAAFIIGGLSYSIIAMSIISRLSPVGYEYVPRLSANPVIIFQQFVNSPEKQSVLLYTFLSFTGIPFFSIGAVSAILLDLSQYFVTGPEFSRMWSPYMHHRAILAVFLALGTLEVFSYLNRKKISLSIFACILIISAFIQQYVFHFPLNKLIKSVYWNHSQWMKDTDALLQYVPKNASVAATQHIVPHLSHRQYIYLLYPRIHDRKDSVCGQTSCWWLDSAGSPEYMIVNTDQTQWLTQLLESPENFLSAVNNMEKAGVIRLEKSIGTAYLYRYQQ